MVSSGTIRPARSSFVPPSAKRPKIDPGPDAQPQESDSVDAAPLASLPPVPREEPFQVLVPTLPPIFSKMKSLPSPGFVMHLMNALEQVPIRLRKAVSDWGYKIVAATKIPDVLPEFGKVDHTRFINKFMPPSALKRVQKELAQRNWWVTSTSRSPSFPKIITMPETAWKCFGVLQFNNLVSEVNPDQLKDLPLVLVHKYGFIPKPAERPGWIMLHELGHAVDDYLGNYFSKGADMFLSESVEFTKAYEADINTMCLPCRPKFTSFLPREDNPLDVDGEARAEAFAELFSRLQVPKDAYSETDVMFQAHFPRVSEFIKTNVIKPWMGPSPAEEGKSVPASSAPKAPAS